MLKLDMGSLVQAVAITAMMEQMMSGARDNDIPPWNPSELIKPTSAFASEIRKLKICAEAIGAKYTLLSIDRTLSAIDAGNCDLQNLLIRIQMIHGRLKDEIDSTYVFYVPADAAKYFDETPLFGQEVATAFPSAAFDIEEAGKCLGLRRATACVTHLMRALEIALKAMAKPLGVSAEHTNWHPIIDQIESKIKGMNSDSHGATWKDEQAFYSAAAVHFRMLKDGWRNHAMHVREKYTEEQAEDIFRSARSFMRHLSLRLSE